MEERLIKKGEMSAVHCTFELKDNILTTDSKGSHSQLPVQMMEGEEENIQLSTTIH